MLVEFLYGIGPSHRAMTSGAIPASSKLMALACRNRCGETGRRSDEPFDLPEGSEASQGFSITVGQERHRGSQMIFANPLAEQPLGLAPQWKRAALAPFTLKFHLLGLRSQHIQIGRA